METDTKKGLQTFAYQAVVVEKFSEFLPIDIKPRVGLNYVLNGLNNSNYKIYRDAYDDSPTNSAIIDAYVAYMYGDGLFDEKTNKTFSSLISDEDVLLACQDIKTYGGCSLQVIWGDNQLPLLVKYVPIYKLGIKYNLTSLEVEGYWFSYDWTSRYKYVPVLYPKFTNNYKGNNLEILMIKNPTAEPFFPVPDYKSGLLWARIEGQIGNYGVNFFLNGVHDVTVINYNNGKQESTEIARVEAEKVRDQVRGTGNSGKIIVAFNDSLEEAVTMDKFPVSELSQNITFLTEEAERKLIVAHSAPPILFSGSNSGGGFSNNADEISIATKMLYRKKIEPMRKIFITGFKKITDLLNANSAPKFKDFEEKQLDNNS